MSSMFGSSVNPSITQPIVGSTLEKDVLDSIINTAGIDGQETGYPTLRGITPYPGQLTPDMSKTMLPGVYGSWAPWMSGEGWQANQLAYNPAVHDPMNYTNPVLSNMMQWGGTGGPGNKAMSLMMQYGAPSAAGQYEGNMAQFGVASEGSGRPLADLAYGKPSSPALAYLAPFMTARPYSAPMIPG